MSDSKIFSLEGKGLKLDTAEDLEPHVKDLRANNDVEEIRLLGNTLGIGASEALAKILETKEKLQVCLPHHRSVYTSQILIFRIGRKPRRHLHLAPPL
jgi:Ran GTPase-activating protein 1